MTLKEQRKFEIIKAAIKIFGKHGFYDAKIKEIAEEAGIGKGTVYEYFKSKKDLFNQMIEHIVKTYFYNVKDVMKKHRTTKEKLLAFAQHHGNFINEHINMVENVIPISNFLSEEIKNKIFQMQKSIYSLIYSILEEGIEREEIRDDLNIKIATISILGAINQNYTSQIFFEKKDPKEIDPRPIIDTIFNGFANK